mgnify:CR=1 FL=1
MAVRTKIKRNVLHSAWLDTDLSSTSNLSGARMTAAANTKYTSDILDLSAYRHFIVNIKVVTAGAVGAAVTPNAKLTLLLYADDGTTQIGEMDIATVIDTMFTATTTYNAITFGVGQAVDTTLVGGTGASLPTTAIAGGPDGFICNKVKLQLEVVVASDQATSSMATVYLNASS